MLWFSCGSNGSGALALGPGSGDCSSLQPLPLPLRLLQDVAAGGTHTVLLPAQGAEQQELPLACGEGGAAAADAFSCWQLLWQSQWQWPSVVSSCLHC